jgi:diadenosine tetraphosphatase ApaH/serine/threonine PP2A family protein phosphatase
LKYGIFSDVHGNLEALEAVLGAMERDGAERLWCLGDVVGYGANPNECAVRVRDAAESVVLGNHDAACAGAEPIEHFNPKARDAVQWTARHLSEATRSWLRDLPLTITHGDVLLVHASPHEPAAWHYISPHMKQGDMMQAFASLTARVAFVGHSHQPLILVHREQQYYRFLGDHLYLEDSGRYLINVGSAGQPRDGNPQAAYALYDTLAGTVTLSRVAYDIGTAQRKIRDAGLPEALADRLESGN